jgi:hypothetical protein
MFTKGDEFITLTGYDAWAEKMAYMGFSVKPGLFSLAQVAKAMGPDDFNKGAQILIGINNHYGPKALDPGSKAYARLKAKTDIALDGMTILQLGEKAAKTFGLVAHSANLAPEKLTLGRLATLLPHVTAAMYIKMKKRGHGRDFLKTGAELDTAKATVPEWLLYPGMVIFAKQGEVDAIKTFAKACDGVLPGSAGKDSGKIVMAAYTKRTDYGTQSQLDGLRSKLDALWAK